MSCKRCPHHVKHGTATPKGEIMFFDVCGLKVKRTEREELEKAPLKKPLAVADKKAGATRVPRPAPTEEHLCTKVPFDSDFEYLRCETYFATFRTINQKNDVIPTKDFQYSDAFNSISITDMELL